MTGTGEQKETDGRKTNMCGMKVLSLVRPEEKLKEERNIFFSFWNILVKFRQNLGIE